MLKMFETVSHQLIKYSERAFPQAILYYTQKALAYVCT